MTDSEKQNIIESVLSALRTNSRTISQLTPVTDINTTDYIEVSGGRKVSYGTLSQLIKSLSDADFHQMQLLIENNVLSSVIVDMDDNTATLSISSNRKTISTSIPIATSSSVGLITPTEKAQIAANATAITDLQHANGALQQAISALDNAKASKASVASITDEVHAATENVGILDGKAIANATAITALSKSIGELAPDYFIVLSNTSKFENNTLTIGRNSAVYFRAKLTDEYARCLIADGVFDFNEQDSGRALAIDMTNAQAHVGTINPLPVAFTDAEGGGGALQTQNKLPIAVKFGEVVTSNVINLDLMRTAQLDYMFSFDNLKIEDGTLYLCNSFSFLYTREYSDTNYSRYLIARNVTFNLSDIPHNNSIVVSLDAEHIDANGRLIPYVSGDVYISTANCFVIAYTDNNGNIFFNHCNAANFQGGEGMSEADRQNFDNLLQRVSGLERDKVHLVRFNAVTTINPEYLQHGDGTDAVYCVFYDTHSRKFIGEGDDGYIDRWDGEEAYNVIENGAVTGIRNDRIYMDEDVCDFYVPYLGNLVRVGGGFVNDIQNATYAIDQRLIALENASQGGGTSGGGTPSQAEDDPITPSLLMSLAADVQGHCRIYVLCRAGGKVTCCLDGNADHMIVKYARPDKDTILMFDDATRNALPNYLHSSYFPFAYRLKQGDDKMYDTNSTDLLDVLAIPITAANTSAVGLFCFLNCPLERIYKGFWDTSNLTKMSLYANSAVRNVDFSDVRVAFPLTDGMLPMFNKCAQLESVVMPWGAVSGSMASVFGECRALRSVGLENLDTSQVNSWRTTFSECNELESVNGTLKGGGDCYAMFRNCRTLRSVDLNLQEAVSDMRYMFMSCSALVEIDLSRCDLSAVQKQESAFSGCAALKHLDISTLDTGALTDSPTEIVSTCSALEYVTLGAAFFKTTEMIRFAHRWGTAYTLGLNADGTNNGWLEHLANVAPSITTKSALNLPDDAPLLVEDENDHMALTDGVARTIQLHANLKNKPWAEPLLATLAAKGYTIA